MSSPPPLPVARTSAKSSNIVLAGLFLLFASWTMVADLWFPFDILLQTSSSSLMLAFFIGGWLFASVITAIFPKRIVVAAFVLVSMRVGIGWPLNYVVGNTLAAGIISVLIFGLASYYFLASWKDWLATSNRPGLRLRHSLVMLPVWLVSGPISLVPVSFGVLQGLDNFAGSYVEVSLQGVSLKERVFEKDSRRIRLTGMVHIADSSFYQNLAHRQMPNATERHLVLTEGVSDKQRILPESFASGETYAKLASKLGLEPQSKPKRVEDVALPGALPGLTYINADCDISDLDLNHQELLVRILTFLDEAELPQMFVMPEGITPEDVHDLMTIGLLQTRNDHLMGVLDKQLGNYDEVHIPWGAAHLPDIEQRLLGRGYQMVEEIDQPAIDFLKWFR